MSKRLSNFGVVLSLLICVGAAGLWARSYHRLDGVLWTWTTPQPGHTRGLILYSGAGGVQLSFVDERFDFVAMEWPAARTHAVRHWAEDDPVRAGERERGASYAFRHDAWGFGADQFGTQYLSYYDVDAKGLLPWSSPDRPPDAQTCTSDVVTRRVWFPAWAVVVSAAALPARHFYRRTRAWRVRRRLRRGLCGSCGYDVRATPERCPECGGWQAVGP